METYAKIIFTDAIHFGNNNDKRNFDYYVHTMSMDIKLRWHLAGSVNTACHVSKLNSSDIGITQIVTVKSMHSFDNVVGGSSVVLEGYTQMNQLDLVMPRRNTIIIIIIFTAGGPRNTKKLLPLAPTIYID